MHAAHKNISSNCQLTMGKIRFNVNSEHDGIFNPRWNMVSRPQIA
jgi:hypothetical protein